MAGVTNANARSSAIDALLATTLDKYYKSGKMHDSIFKSNPTFAKLREKGKIEYADGGYQINVGLMYGKNTTVGSYSRYEVLDVAPQDGMTQAIYPWAQYAGAVAIDGLSEFQNAGAGKLVKLLGEKVEQTTLTFAETINEDMHDISGVSGGTTGNSGKNIVSLAQIAYKDGYTNYCGGIDPNTYTWWKNAFYEDTPADSFIGYLKALQLAYMEASKGSGGAPDLGICDQYSYETYESAMDEKKRYVKSDRATAGFESIYYKGMQIMWDEHVGDQNADVNWDDTTNWADGTFYLLNTKFLKLFMGKGKDFRPTGFVRPVDQDARVNQFIAYLQLVTSNRRKQCVWYEIADDITS